MRPLRSIATLLLVASQAAGSAGAESPLSLTGFVTYRLTMRTSLRVDPARDVSVLRVWHATPTPRKWSMTGGELGCLDLRFTPASGVLQHREDKDSRHVYWELKAPFAGDGGFAFESTLLVNSCVRRFDARESKTVWEDYESPDSSGDADDELSRLVARLKHRYRPAELVRRACLWINDELTYDASVGHSTGDLPAILRTRRGHCGHYYRVLKAVCDEAAIPIRRARGLNLYAPDGVGRLGGVRADYDNIHTWAEVHFPRDGWIEVEPSADRRPFRIPARFVQNNRWFQNYAIWLREGDRWVQPKWLPRSGGWDSDCEVANRIVFEVVRPQGREAARLPRKWESRGGHAIYAALLDALDDRVRLATSDGRQITVPLDALSESDRSLALSTLAPE